jgi:hypothetical protein
MLDENGHKNLYPRFHKRFCKVFEKAMAHVSLCIYNSEYLQQDYRKAFPDNKSEVLYTLSTWTPTPYVPKEGRFQVTYFGNISDGRTDSLIDVANALSNLDKPYSFDVYGPVGREKDLQKLQSCPLLHYHQPIPYEQVRKLAEDSDLLIHVESFDPFIAKDRKNAFSTKIMDCLASGRPFLLYAPKEMAESRFLQEKGLADCANNKEQLGNFLANFPAKKSEWKEKEIISERNHQKMSDCFSGL